jgi:hypothetical protein
LDLKIIWSSVSGYIICLAQGSGILLYGGSLMAVMLYLYRLRPISLVSFVIFLNEVVLINAFRLVDFHAGFI